ncbi:MAG: glycine cleavage system protein R [Gammaproteobacteria bacterium]|nr:glycine cleavage system protein R [Gammaproteobacteria bacterium]MDH5593544.1 glycine cleavage system protein R [Gammaproteobacteria bacterium]MDH5613657.1 glycine cleavage system protein R [Gammaproteobacteria bacterium]
MAKKKNNYLVISALGADRPGIVNDLSSIILENQCNIVDSRMSMLGGEFAIILMISGNWNDVAKLEDKLPQIQKKLGLVIAHKRTEERSQKTGLVPYEVEVISIDRPGIMFQLANFFSTRDINIEEVNTNSYAAAHTGTPMFATSMIVDIPANVSVTSLREEFLDFCDEHNMDAAIEALKG